MKKAYWVAGIALILLIAAGIFIYNFNQQSTPNNQITQECSNQGGYCIYNNIPPGMLYTDPNQEIPENFSVDRQTTIDTYFKRTSSKGQELHESFGLDTNKYVCSNDNKIVVINYFYDLCEGMENLVGCGYERKALVCDDIYFIEQYSDVTGPVLYGLFSLE